MTLAANVPTSLLAGWGYWLIDYSANPTVTVRRRGQQATDPTWTPGQGVAFYISGDTFDTVQTSSATTLMELVQPGEASPFGNGSPPAVAPAAEANQVQGGGVAAIAVGSNLGSYAALTAVVDSVAYITLQIAAAALFAPDTTGFLGLSFYTSNPPANMIIARLIDVGVVFLRIPIPKGLTLSIYAQGQASGGTAFTISYGYLLLAGPVQL